MELFWVFVLVVIADIATTLTGYRIGLEDVWFGRRVAPMLVLAAAQIAGFYAIMLLLPLVPYMRFVVYAVLALRAAVVIWNIYLLAREKNNVFFLSPFSADGDSGGVSVVPGDPSVAVYAGRVEDHQHVYVCRLYRPGEGRL